MADPAVDPERRWLRDVYQPGARQLTVRAVAAGMLLGGLMALSNLYVFLKTGWSLGVTVTACILAWVAFRLLQALRLTRAAFSPLENNAMGSVASAAGYMTGGGNMAALPALLLLTGTSPGPLAMFLWFAVIAALGVFIAIPVKRQLVNVEQLPFPTGTATAETIRALHGGAGAAGSARLLLGGGLAGAVLAWLRDARFRFMPGNLPDVLPLPFTIGGLPALRWSLGIEASVMLLGAGAIMSLRVGWSMLLGALLTYGVLAPWMVARGVIATVSYRGIVQWSLWGGAAVLVSSGLLSFAFQWRSIARSFAEVTRVFRPLPAGADPLAAVECPPAWFPLGTAAFGAVAVVLMRTLFGVPVWAGLLAIPLAVIAGFVAARVTGETDTTPTKALGPVTQLLYGALVPGNVAANVMVANVTGGAGLHAADLLTDLKSGYLLGANPRRQLVAQLFGVVAGAAVVVPAFHLLIPEASLIGSAQWPAPSALVWKGVSEVLAAGVGALPPAARLAALAGFAVGTALALAEKLLPARARAFLPSPSGLGLSMVIPGYNSVAMFAGALLAAGWRRARPAQAERAVVPLSSGLIAGESLMGIGLAVAAALGLMGR